MSALRTISTIGVCIAGSAAFSIGPQLPAVWKDASGVDPAVWQFLIVQTAATIVMALASHYMAHASQVGQKLACLGLVLVVGAFQFGSALDVSSHVQDSRSAVGAGSLSERAGVTADLGIARDSRAKLPVDQQAYVTEQMEADARQAKTDECAKRGPLCRAKEDELKIISARRAIFAKIDELEAKEKLLGTGTPWIDGRAYRFGKILHAAGADIGKDETERTAWVMDWWPSFQAFVVELIAGLGPYALADTGKPRGPRSWVQWIKARLPRRRPKVEAMVPASVIEAIIEPSAVAPGVVIPAVRKTPGTPEKAKKVRKSNTPAVTPAREWWHDRTVEREGADIRPKEEAYPDYVAFAEGRGEVAMTLTAFGTELRNMAVPTRTLPSKAKLYTNRALAHRAGLKVVK